VRSTDRGTLHQRSIRSKSSGRNLHIKNVFLVHAQVLADSGHVVIKNLLDPRALCGKERVQRDAPVTGCCR
jgi:hypothetical protein